MNIFLQTAQKINVPDLPQQQNLSSLNKTNFDSFLFNSIMDNFKAENTDKKIHEQDQLSSKKTESYSNRFEEKESKRSLRSDNKSYDQKADDLEKKSRVENELKGQKTSKAENQQDEDVYKKGVFNEKVESDKPATESYEESEEKNTVINESGSNSENVALMLNELIPNAGLMNLTMENPNTVAAKNDVPSMNTVNGDLKHPVNNQTIPVQKDDMVNVHKDIKSSALMSHFMKGVQATGDSEMNPIINSETTNSPNSEISTTKNSSKIAGAILELNDKSLQIENESADEIMRMAELKTDNSDSKSNMRELLAQTNKNAENTINQIKMHQPIGDMHKAGVGAENNNGLILTNKLMSQLSGNINTGDGNNFTHGSAKTVTAGSEAHDTAMFSDSRFAAEKGTLNEGFKTGHINRQGSFNEIIDKIVYVAKGNNRLGVSLEHERFGKIHINLSMEKGVVNVHLNTADHALREYVENNIHHIIDSLSKNGLNIGGFSVSLKNHDKGDGNSERESFSEDKIENKEYAIAKESAKPSDGLVNIFA